MRIRNAASVSGAAVRELYEDLRELHQAGGSSNDWVQAVDDWFVEQGFPTIIYGEP